MGKLKRIIQKYYYYTWASIFFQGFIDYLLVGPYFHLIKKTQITFIGQRPELGKNYIVVSNHRSYNDPPLLGHAIHQPVSFIAKKELFKNPLLTLFMMLSSTISIDRTNAQSETFSLARRALNSKRILGKCWCVGMFIEGTRSKAEGMLGKPNKGVMLLARMARVPIIPVGISYRGDSEIVVKIGEPYEIDYEADLIDEAWKCLEKIELLSDYKMPERVN